MSPDRLRQYSRKQLEVLARTRGVGNIRSLKKDELIDALSISAERGSALASPSSPDRAATGRRSMPTIPHTDASVKRRAFVAEAGMTDSLQVSVVDDQWLRASWQISQASLDRASAALGREWHLAKAVVQLSDVTPEVIDETSRESQEIVLSPGTPTWFLRIRDASRTFRVALGYRTPAGRFHLLIRSRPVTPSRSRIATGSAAGSPQSTDADSDWPDVFPTRWNSDGAGDETAAMESKGSRSGRRSGTDGVAVQDHRVAGASLRVQLDAELVIRGVTTPGTEVKLMGRPVSVSHDGRFCQRVPVTSGRQIIPAVALAADHASEQTVLLAVETSIRELEPRTFDDL